MLWNSSGLVINIYLYLMICNSDSHYWNFTNFKAIYGFVRVSLISWWNYVWLTRKRSDTISTVHLIVMTRKGKSWKRYKSRYYYMSPCGRICEISLYFSNLNSLSKGFMSAQQLSQDHMGCLDLVIAPVHASWLVIRRPVRKWYSIIKP